MGEARSTTFPREQFAATVQHLATRGLYLGTSSWKYPGWLGMLYTSERYRTRGRFSEAKFERECLREYASVLASVCVDGSYYRFPSPKFLEQLFQSVDANPLFKCSFKVADEITARRFANLPRHGERAGKLNPHFLNAELFVNGVLKPLEPYRNQTGTLILEFTRLKKSDGLSGQEFLRALDHFFEQLPKDWNYSVEIRNASLLRPEYFDVLNRHGVSHVFNQWTRMPEVEEQWRDFKDVLQSPHAAFRMLLAKDRTYEQAVSQFSPYQTLKEAHPGVRRTMRAVVDEVTKGSVAKRQHFLYVNNRLEGNSLLTLTQLLQEMDWLGVPPIESSKPHEVVQNELFANPH